MSDKLKIGITVGDINGIGLEVIIKSLVDQRMCDFFTPIVYG
ncbi:MAG: 4-hydroxythreonine-4-phosphate dehydrogenase PdxA, partial [Sphingobacterium sp.]